jgi:ParB family chromosome partitioning protein
LGWTSDNIYNTQSFGLEEVLAKSYSIVPFAGDGRLKDCPRGGAQSTKGAGMSPSQDLRELPLGLIEPNLAQPRRCFDQATLQELAGSIGERGVLQPVLVRPSEDGRYGLVAGERRWRAAQIAGLQTIPALISPYDDLAALEAALIENMARENLNPVEEARACATLSKELDLTHQEIADRVGRSASGVSNLTRLNLSVEILDLMERGELGLRHGLALLVGKDPRVRGELARKAVAEGWTVLRLEARARDSNIDVPKAGEGPVEQGLDSEEDVTAMNIARVWGDAVGEEVMVRAMSHRKLRVEFVFESPEGALAVGGRLAETIARGSKRR